MNIDHVSLDEVFAAAAARTASLVPETSGYLALALGDAIARRPSAHDDRAVMLSTEGAVTVTRRGEPVSPRQAAEALRDVLARLLAASAGTMPGLAAAARAREESDRGVEAVIEEIEAALIPVNRAAARRALARLSRETFRARDIGKIAVMLPAEDVREETPPLPSPNPALVLAVNEVTPAASCREPTPTVLGMPPVEPVEPVEPPPDDGLDLAAPTELDVVTEVDLSPSPSRTIPLARRRAPARVSPQGAPPTRADDLLSRFSVSGDGEDRMRETAASLKRLAGLDPTPPLPAPALPIPAPALPASSPPASPEDRFFHGFHGDLDAAPSPAPAVSLPARRRLRPSVGAAGALLVGALAAALVVARARPDLLTSLAVRIAPPSAAREAAPAAQPGAEARAR